MSAISHELNLADAVAFNKTNTFNIVNHLFLGLCPSSLM
jgi:hypothetical protein